MASDLYDMRASLQAKQSDAQSQTMFFIALGVVIALGIAAGLFLIPTEKSDVVYKVAQVESSDDQPTLPETFAAVTPSTSPLDRNASRARAREIVKKVGLPLGEERLEQLSLYMDTTSDLLTCSARKNAGSIRNTREAYITRNKDVYIAWSELRGKRGEKLAKLQDMNEFELGVTLMSGQVQRAAMEEMAEMELLMGSTGTPKKDLDALACSKLNTQTASGKLDLKPVPTS